MHRFLKWAGFALLGVVGLVVMAGVAVYVWGEGWARDYATGRGSETLGREFAIDGAFDIDIDGWMPRVHAEGVRLSNASWAKDPNMIEIEAVDLRIDLRGLFLGRLVLPELTLTRPKILLEKADADTKNWDLSVASSGGVAVAVAVPQTRDEFPVIGQLIVTDGTVSYTDKPGRIALTATITTAEGTADDSERHINLQSKGTLDGQPFTLEALGGSILELRDTAKPYPLKLTLRAGRTAFGVQGTVTDPLQMAGIDMWLSVEGASMSDIFPFTRIPLPPTRPFKVTGQLHKEAELWRFEQFSGYVGQSDLTGNLQYDASKERPFVKAALVSRRLAFEDLAGFIGAGPAQGAQSAQAASRLLPDVPLELNRLRAADLDITLRAARVDAPDLPLEKMNAHFVLKDGRLRVDPLEFGVAEGTIAGNLVLDGRRDIPQVDADLALRRLSLRDFFKGSQFESLSNGRFGGKVVIVGQGRSLAQVLATANGRTTLSMSGGTVSRLTLQAVNVDLAKAAVTLLGGDQPAEVNCAIADFRVDNGVLRSETFVIDTTESNIEGTAAVEFGRENMDIRIMGHPKSASPLVARTPITITGPMKSPRIGIDPTGIVARGAAAAALGIALTPLAAILPFIELGLGEDSNCGALIERARAIGAAPDGPTPGQGTNGQGSNGQGANGRAN